MGMGGLVESLRPPLMLADDRGVEHEVRAERLAESGAARDPRTRFVMEQALEVLTPGRAPESQRAMKLFQLSIVVMVLLALGVITLGATRVIRPPVAPMLIVFVVLVAVWSLVFQLVVLRRSMRRAVPRLAPLLCRHGLCAVCAYDLSATPPERDGCIVCPECGGAWKGDRIVSAAAVRESTGPVTLRESASRIGRKWVGWMRRQLVIDDRGNGRRLLVRHPRERLRDAGDGGDPELRSRLEAAHRLVRRSGARRRVLISLALVGFAGMEVWIMVGLLGPMGAAAAPWRRVLSPAVMSVWFVALAAVNLRGNLGTSVIRCRRTMLEARLCPSCSDDLARAGVDGDGVTTCPTCGAGWRVG